MSNCNVKILHLYPDMLNLYGDKGNIEALKKRLLWRGIEAEVCALTEGNENIDFENIDILYLGGGSDREQENVLSKLSEYKNEIKSFVESGKTLIATCGGFEMLGKTLYSDGRKIEGLGILNIETEVLENKQRLIGNVIARAEFMDSLVVGFENHAGRININGMTPLLKVITGNGNSDKCGEDGVIYKNLYGTNLHGPLFPKNPMLCDFILFNTLKHKYPDFNELLPLDDELECMANNYIVKVYSQK